MQHRRGKCPKCDILIDQMATVSVPLRNRDRVLPYDGIAHLCPYCQVLLGVSADTVALAHDVVDAIVITLRKAEAGRRRLPVTLAEAETERE